MGKTAPKQLESPRFPASKKAASRPVREKLLEEAVRLFAARGFDGVTVDEIVAAAAVNKRMVYHYFGSKDGIYSAALERVFKDLEKLEAGLISARGEQQDLETALQGIVFVYFDFLEQHPEFVRLLLWENLQEGLHLRKLDFAVNKNPMLGYLRELLRTGAAQGFSRANLDARRVLISLIGLCQVYFSNRYTLSLTVGVDLSSGRVLKHAAVHTARLFLEGLRA